MKTLFTILVLTALVSIGCAGPYRSGKVNVTKTPGDHTVEGHSYDTIGAIEATSRATINERLADACVAGNTNACYSFLNGYYGHGHGYNYGYGSVTEAGFYGYGPGGLIPNPGLPATTSTGGGGSDTSARAEKKADAAIKAVKKILKKLAEDE